MAFNAGDAANIGFADRLEGISPTQAEALRAAAERPGLEGGLVLGGGASGAFTVVRDRGPSLFVLVALVLGGAFAAVVVLKAIRRSARFASRDPRALASACRRDVVGYLADQGVDVPPSATMPEIGGMLARFYSIDADPFVRDVTLARFGPPARAGEALRGATARAPRDPPWPAPPARGASRLRGAASLRSLSV